MRDFSQIVSHSLTLFERKELGFHNLDYKCRNKENADRKLAEWRKVVANEDDKLFDRRLEIEKLNKYSALRLIDLDNVGMVKAVPSWVSIIEEIINSFETKKIFRERAPFESVLISFVETARAHIKRGVPLKRYSLLSKKAHGNLEFTLLRNLALICSAPMVLELNIARVRGKLEGCSPQDRYHYFLYKFLGTTDALYSFFNKYSVLARLVATRIDEWVSVTTNFLARLECDLDEIRLIFSEEKKFLGKVIDIKDSLSDLHDGDTVKYLKFESGLEIIYKPRGMGLEEAYFQLLEWFNRSGAPFKFKNIAVLNKGTHGWTEFVSFVGCDNKEQVRNFYRRSGANLCLFYLLGATDCHFENVIAHGEYPVLIDAETVMHLLAKTPQTNDISNGKKTGCIDKSFSVLNTGLLPSWDFGDFGDVGYDYGGLSGPSSGKSPIYTPTLKNKGTDQMRLVFDFTRIKSSKNKPLLAGNYVNAADYVEEIVFGFSKMYSYILSKRDSFLAESPLISLGRQKVRFVNRNTRVYYNILYSSLTPDCLRDGIDRSIKIDALYRSVLLNNQEYLNPVLLVERKALEDVCIPRITIDPCSSSIVLEGKGFDHFFVNSTYENVVSRVNSMNFDDLYYQSNLIRRSFDTVHPHSAKFFNLQLRGKISTETKVLDRTLEIADEIKEKAIRSAENDATWIGLEYLPQLEQCFFQPLGYDLYSGLCGIALFYSALDFICPGKGNREFALLCLGRLRKLLNSDDVSTLTSLGIGGMTGLGSIIYSFVRVSQYISDKSLLDDAERLANLITPNMVDLDESFDVVAGAAGAILALLTLNSVRPSRGLIERSIICGEHLLKNQVGGNEGWKRRHSRVQLASFSHGVAGISYALLSLYKITGDLSLFDAARKAILFEDTFFLKEKGNWLDLRYSESGRCMTSWCHGAPGIGLGRIAILEMLDTPTVRRDIERALMTTINFPNSSADQLCCGNLGRIDFILEASIKLSRPDLYKIALSKLLSILRRAENRGFFQLFNSSLCRVYNPSLFRGTAGIGYGMLRAIFPGELRSVLLLA